MTGQQSHNHTDTLPHDYKKASENFYFLINFLGRVDVNINDPSHYFDCNTDFQGDPKSIVVAQTDFLNSLKKQIYELAN